MPTLQSRHVPTDMYCPLLHDNVGSMVQLELPGEEVYPVGQILQSVTSAAPEMLENVPDAQAMHPVEAVVLLNVPGGHS